MCVGADKSLTLPKGGPPGAELDKCDLLKHGYLTPNELDSNHR